MKIAFVGGGTMAEAILGGILENKIAKTQDITAGEIIADRRALGINPARPGGGCAL